MAFLDYREPIEYVVDRYFARKRFHETNNAGAVGVSLGRGEYPDDRLPQIPCLIIRDEDGKARKFIYGESALLESDDESDPVIWQEELIRDDDGKVTRIVTTYPDGESVTTELVREDGKVLLYRYLEGDEGYQSGGTDTQEHYLRMFVTTDVEASDYVDPLSIGEEYPQLDTYWMETAISLGIPTAFFEGRNALRDLFSNASPSPANTGATDNYHRYLWKLTQDAQNALSLSPLENGFSAAQAYMSEIGIGDVSQQVSIYMTYQTRIPNLAFPSFTANYDCGNNLDGFVKYVQKDKCFVLDWIDWCDIESDSDLGGFAIDWSVPGFKACLNIEPDIQDFPINGNGVQKVHQYKLVGANPCFYVAMEGAPDPYDVYSWKDIAAPDIEREAMLAHVSIHEMGHAVDAYAKYRGSASRLAYSNEWLEIWKWTTVATTEQFQAPDAYKQYPKFLTDYHMNWDMSKGEPPLTYYGCTDPLEDFAESYACYVTNRQYLQEKYPKRYAFMQSHVDTMTEG